MEIRNFKKRRNFSFSIIYLKKKLVEEIKSNYYRHLLKYGELMGGIGLPIDG